ncbi:hypothetical protein M406DRAFT_345500 [Cryphonectria parasitica EP155]|uniref:Uncharacterized protein n=1 Tax=Cryphonectria parasitica (strain ATCC 38755 / EP155) TaxID=660469 RepID=A0A9P4Y7K3_CRYP1|nr:uncharacterized protein M406DRAFT_345500 [Cryphonectria parasitica EP155]KAF3767550.1 hypothetical protein M406DRAFT_345500 [Cryphonectria parasitica EP155]
MASSSAPDRPKTENQASDLPGVKVLITSHNGEGKAVVRDTEPVKWVLYDQDRLAMSILWTTQFPTDLNDEADLKLHKDRMAKGATGLALGGGTVLRYVDFAPGYQAVMHRTQSVDYGIVTAGSIIAGFDSGEEHLMQTGDVCVQRATMHSWRNPSDTEWARMIFCLQDAKPLFVGEERLKEADLGKELGVRPSAVGT